MANNFTRTIMSVLAFGGVAAAQAPAQAGAEKERHATCQELGKELRLHAKKHDLSPIRAQQIISEMAPQIEKAMPGIGAKRPDKMSRVEQGMALDLVANDCQPGIQQFETTIVPQLGLKDDVRPLEDTLPSLFQAYIGGGMAFAGEEHGVPVITGGVEWQRPIRGDFTFRTVMGLQGSFGVDNDSTTAFTPSGVNGYDFAFTNDMNQYINARVKLGLDKQFGRLEVKGGGHLGYLKTREEASSATVTSPGHDLVIQGPTTTYERNGLAGGVWGGLDFTITDNLKVGAEASKTWMLSGTNDYDNKGVTEVTGHVTLSTDSLFGR